MLLFILYASKHIGGGTVVHFLWWLSFIRTFFKGYFALLHILFVPKLMSDEYLHIYTVWDACNPSLNYHCIGIAALSYNDQVNDDESTANLHCCKQIISLINEISTLYSGLFARTIEISLVIKIRVIKSSMLSRMLSFVFINFNMQNLIILKMQKENQAINYFIKFSWLIINSDQEKSCDMEKTSQIWENGWVRVLEGKREAK